MNHPVCSVRQHLRQVERQMVLVSSTPVRKTESSRECLYRTAIGNERIRSINEGEVAFTVRAKTQGGKRLHRMDGTEFVRRLLLHVLPSGVKRIRHYGVLASACKGNKLSAARLALQMPALNPQALESAQAFMARVARMDVGLCPVCKVGHLQTVEVLAGVKQLPALGAMVWPQQRGPP